MLVKIISFLYRGWFVVLVDMLILMINGWEVERKKVFLYDGVRILFMSIFFYNIV